jgi:hypothetical protein
MAWTIETALDDEVIENPRKSAEYSLEDNQISEYQFNLRDIDAVLITIRLYKSIDGERVKFEQSHYFDTPRLGPYGTDNPWGDYEAHALRRAARTFTEPYKEAVRQGKSPSEDWLVLNEDFFIEDKKAT